MEAEKLPMQNLQIGFEVEEVEMRNRLRRSL